MVMLASTKRGEQGKGKALNQTKNQIARRKPTMEEDLATILIQGLARKVEIFYADVSP